MAVNIGPKIGVDGEAEYRRQINQIIQQSKTLESQMKLVASSFTSATSAEEKSAKTSAVLTKQIEVQRARVKLLAEQTGKAAAKYGEADIRTQKYQEQLNKATASLNKMQNELRDTSRGVEDLGEDMNVGKSKALSFGDVLKANLASEFIVSGIKAMASAIKEAASALAELGKQSIMGFAEQEQLIGGVDTLFKESSAQVQQYANEAYKTAGLSANQYMETVTSFSASLLQSMGGDTQAAAEKANRAITDMSDNANKMGTDMTSIQNAYQGFAKQNYTMLDNLKLGYGGTKQEMERLVAEAAAMTEEQEKLNVAVNAGDLSFSNIVDAISVVQEHLDIAGTTADEAATTIQGSANAMKSAWRNLITGMSNENLDLGELVQNTIDSINIFADNLTTRLQIMLPRFAEGLNKLVTGLIPYVGPALELLLPSLVQGIGGLVSGIVQALPAAVEAITAVIPMLVEQLTILLPQIISAGVEIIAALASGIGENLPTLIPAVVDAIITITEGLLDHIDLLIIAAGQLIVGLAEGLIKAIPRLIGRLPEIISAIVNGLLKGLAAIGEVGLELVKGLFNGISNAAKWLYEKVKGWASSVVGWIKDFFGIHSPSKVFADEVGKFIPPGITLGVEQAMPRAMRAMGDELAALTDIPLPGAGSTTTTNMGGVVLNVYGAEGQDVNALADAVMYRLQSAVERKEAVFA
jgi:phage-related protein|nr:MAG TPA: tail tape measure protein [Caudoviricetes sp.]